MRDVDAIEADLGEKMQQLLTIQGEINQLKAAWIEARDEVVKDFTFQGPDGPVQLSELFGDKDDLVVIHNMGKNCAWCTLWADGFIGLAQHIEARCALALTSPDSPADQAAFAESRGWPFRMLSLGNSGFAEAMGFKGEEGYLPGYSTFHRRADGSILRVSKDPWGPGDSYCGIWHILPNLHGGAAGWQPQLSY